MDYDRRVRLLELSKLTAGKLTAPERGELARLSVEKDLEKEDAAREEGEKRDESRRKIMASLQEFSHRMEQVPHELPCEDLEWDLQVPPDPSLRELSRALSDITLISSRIGGVLAQAARCYGRREQLYQRALAAWRETCPEEPQWSMEASLHWELDRAGGALYRELIYKREEIRQLRELARLSWERILALERLVSRQVTILLSEQEILAGNRQGDPRRTFEDQGVRKSDYSDL